MPLSPLDLPLIVEAVSELYRIIEHPPAENWQAPVWLTEQYKKTTAGKIPFQPGEKPSHAWLIHVAAIEVLNRIMPPWYHIRKDCQEITESILNRHHQIALIKLRKRLLTYKMDVNVSNQSALLEELDFLGTMRSQLRASQTTKHSDDFSSVIWFDTAYNFTKGLQAESVRVLWEAWENGTPNLSQGTIRERIGSANDSFRLEHVFQPTRKSTGHRAAHPAWGTMIKSAGKGIFALSPP